MKVSIGIGGASSGQRRDFDEQVEYVVEAEKLGVDTVWTAEAWGQDAIAPLAYLAARTSRIRLGTAVVIATHDLQLMDQFGFARRLAVGEGKLTIFDGSPS